MPDDDLQRLAALLSERNKIDAVIAVLIGRPMTAGHLGEWIAADVFDIELDASASTAAIDGRFAPAPSVGERSTSSGTSSARVCST